MIQTYGYDGKPIDEEFGNEPERRNGKTSRPPAKSICLYVGEKTLKEIKQAANLQDKSISRYCADILLEHAKKVNEENRAKVREEIKMMRELRK